MRILSMLAPIINILPESIVRYIGSKASESLLKKYAKLEVKGMQILSEQVGKPTIFIANHLSNVDAIVLNKILKDNNVTFIAGKKLKSNPLTSLFLRMVKNIPISPDSADRNAIKTALAILSAGESILIFPEGTRSRSGSMIKGKKGFLLLAKRSKADIVPIAIEGTNLMLPINQKDMGMETPHHAEVRVNIGQPFRLENNEQNRENWDDICLDTAMRKIARMLKPEYQGVYNTNSVEI